MEGRYQLKVSKVPTLVFPTHKTQCSAPMAVYSLYTTEEKDKLRCVCQGDIKLRMEFAYIFTVTYKNRFDK